MGHYSDFYESAAEEERIRERNHIVKRLHQLASDIAADKLKVVETNYDSQARFQVWGDEVLMFPREALSLIVEGKSKRLVIPT